MFYDYSNSHIFTRRLCKSNSWTKSQSAILMILLPLASTRFSLYLTFTYLNLHNNAIFANEYILVGISQNKTFMKKQNCFIKLLRVIITQ